jgi:hypothetical protein
MKNLFSAKCFDYLIYLVFPIYEASLFFLTLYWQVIYFWLTQCRHIDLGHFVCLKSNWINQLFIILKILIFNQKDLRVILKLFRLCFRFSNRYLLNLGFCIVGLLFLDVYCFHFFSKFLFVHLLKVLLRVLNGPVLELRFLFSFIYYRFDLCCLSIQIFKVQFYQNLQVLLFNMNFQSFPFLN